MSGRRSWWWFFRKFGLRVTVRYWLAGQRQGWLTEEEFPAWLEAHGFLQRGGETAE
jgi:hypothetical protein